MKVYDWWKGFYYLGDCLATELMYSDTVELGYTQTDSR